MKYDKRTASLMDQIDELIEAHYQHFEDEEYKEMLGSVLLVLATQIGHLKFLCTKTGEVPEKNFDSTMWKVIMRTFNEYLSKDSAQH